MRRATAGGAFEKPLGGVPRVRQCQRVFTRWSSGCASRDRAPLCRTRWQGRRLRRLSWLPRTPFPATVHTNPHVGAHQDQQLGAAPRANPQIDGLLRVRERADRQVGSLSLFEVRCRDVCGAPQEVVVPSLTSHVHGSDAGQCLVPSRRCSCHPTRRTVSRSNRRGIPPGT